MRTDWAGSSMDIPPIREAYRPTVGVPAERIREGSGSQPVDPAKVARVFLDIARMDEPPLHLLLGSYTVERIREEMRKLMDEDTRWADTARSVDFD